MPCASEVGELNALFRWPVDMLPASSVREVACAKTLLLPVPVVPAEPVTLSAALSAIVSEDPLIAACEMASKEKTELTAALEDPCASGSAEASGRIANRTAMIKMRIVSPFSPVPARNRLTIAYSLKCPSCDTT